MSLNELAFIEMCKLRGLPLPVQEHRFHPTRRWRFDFAWPAALVALEVEGGIWRKQGGAHQGKGTIRDIEKYNAAIKHGWFVLRCVPGTLATKATIDLVESVLKRQIALLPGSAPDPG